MSYDEALADRVRELLPLPMEEKKMFGGLAFMYRGKMTFGILGSEVMLRLGKHGVVEALALPFMRPMDFTGRVMHTMAFLDAKGLDDESLQSWLGKCMAQTDEDLQTS